MEDIKIGDIKRYKLLDEEMVGAVIEVYNDSIVFIDIYGKKREIRRESIQGVSIVKLSPEVRKALTEFAKGYRAYMKILSEISRLLKQRDASYGELRKQSIDISKIQGLSSYYGAANFVREELLKNKSLTRKGYAVTCSPDYTKETGDEYVINIYTERKVEPSLMGDFIRTSRTAGVLMDTKTEGYKKLVRKMEQKLHKFDELRNGKGYKVSERKSWVEGKHELLYVHNIRISFQTSHINEEVLNEIVKIVQA